MTAVSRDASVTCSHHLAPFLQARRATTITHNDDCSNGENKHVHHNKMLFKGAISRQEKYHNSNDAAMSGRSNCAMMVAFVIWRLTSGLSTHAFDITNSCANDYLNMAQGGKGLTAKQQPNKRHHDRKAAKTTKKGGKCECEARR